MQWPHTRSIVLQVCQTNMGVQLDKENNRCGHRGCRNVFALGDEEC